MALDEFEDRLQGVTQKLCIMGDELAEITTECIKIGALYAITQQEGGKTKDEILEEISSIDFDCLE